ncbi:MAG TPA: hypothetical protein DEA47_01325 [Peptococcaceae bacterium]|nr:MAG: hypothetical protein XD50_0225 [Clostridia bacterium 41_269]HBT20002.1 hypothetical protein [Peptococcaceae bacterium]
MDKTLEQRVLFLVDEFIKTLIDLYEADPEVGEKLSIKAEDIFIELAEEALKLLQGRNEYLEAMLKQLVAQKLPSDMIMKSFEGFEEKMQSLIRKGLIKFQERHLEKLQREFENFESTAEKERESVYINSQEAFEFTEEKESEEEYHYYPINDECPHDVKNSMEDFLRKLFPKEELIKDFKIGNIIFEYYIPDLDLAFEKSSKVRKGCNNFLEMCCYKNGILLLKIDPNKVENLKRMKRKIKLLMAQKNFLDKRIFELTKEYI